jgi:hypothetical protein
VRLSFSLFDERAMFRPLTVEPVNSKFAGRTITSSVGIDHTNIGQICTLIGYILQDERNRPDQRLQKQIQLIEDGLLNLLLRASCLSSNRTWR